MCLSGRHYLVTKSIQLDTDAAQLLNYTSRIELVPHGVSDVSCVREEDPDLGP